MTTRDRMTFEPPPMLGDAFELRVSLRHVVPEVWRRVRVPIELSLGALHDALQLCFGWNNSHLHEFAVGEVRFGLPDEDGEDLCVDERGAPLAAVARPGTSMVYRYDFGDGWEHDLVIEKVVRGAGAAIVCIEGARACPPDDCGGPPGYQHLVEVMKDPKHEDHAELRGWVGRGFDPERLDLAAVNRKLASLAKRQRGLRSRQR